MAHQTKLTGSKVTKINEGLDEGKSSREIAEEAGVSHTTVQKHAAKRKRRASVGAPEVEAAAAEVEALLAGPTPSGLDDVIQLQSVVRGLIARITPLVEADQYPATSFVAICKYYESLSTLRVQLTPPAPKNPDDDPDVREAERVLVARVERLIEAAEERRARG